MAAPAAAPDEDMAPKIVPQPTTDPTCRTFTIDDEDHTLGNSLRYVLMRNPKVDFCGYSIPHPSESALQLRLQTRVGTSTADEVLEEGLRSLKEICSHVRDTFEEAVATHEAENGSGGAGGGAGVTADADMS